MQQPPRIGTTHQRTFTVEAAHAIDFPSADLPPVLATPWLIWFLEETALELMLQYVADGEITVGTHVDVEHLAATPVGEDVICTARVIHVDGPVVKFQLEAQDRHEPVARGLHSRRVVTAARLGERVRRKMEDGR